MENINIKYLNRDVNINVYSGTEIVSDIIRSSKTFYELNFLEYVMNNYNNQKNIIDIGANIGNHSVFFREFMKCDKIYCFEPFPDNVEILRENMKNRNSEVFDIALSDKIGEMTLYNSQQGNNGGFSLECYTHPSSPSYKVLESVQVRTLDSYDLNDISMIKIDVESHELPVLKGSINTILKNKPIVMVEDLSYGYPHMFESNKYNSFFESINYRKIQGNLFGGYMDIWGPII